MLVAWHQGARDAQAGRRFQNQQHALRAEQRRHFLDQECMQVGLDAAATGAPDCARTTR